MLKKKPQGIGTGRQNNFGDASRNSLKTGFKRTRERGARRATALFSRRANHVGEDGPERFSKRSPAKLRLARSAGRTIQNAGFNSFSTISPAFPVQRALKGVIARGDSAVRSVRCSSSTTGRAAFSSTGPDQASSRTVKEFNLLITAASLGDHDHRHDERFGRGTVPKRPPVGGKASVGGVDEKAQQRRHQILAEGEREMDGPARVRWFARAGHSRHVCF